jgi:hypothetical protein
VMETTYYSWLGDDGTYSGLARSRQLPGGGPEFAYASRGVGWIRRQELLGLLLDGDLYFTKIDEPTAQGLAAGLGVDLNAPTEWKEDDDGNPVSLVDGTPAPLVAAAAVSDVAAEVDAAIAASEHLTLVPVEERVWPLSKTELPHVKKALGRR